MSKFQTPRPLTLHFITELFEAVNAHHKEVHIMRLKDDIFFTITKLQFTVDLREVDVIHSDAIILTFISDTPTLVYETSLNKAGLPVSVDKTMETPLEMDPSYHVRNGDRDKGLAVATQTP